MIIGLLGALINNENLGCQALTYSLINILERISTEINEPFVYRVFEFKPNDEKNRIVESKLGLDYNKIFSYDISPLFRGRRFIHHLKTGITTYKALMKCDMIIDLTSGDSFTDIYGQYIFDSLTNVKLLIEAKKKPLFLGPQTYGPFNKANIIKAKKAIERADAVISRDVLSAEYISTFSKCKVFVTTDLAFELPYEYNKKNLSDKINVGINISGLLLNNKTEKTDLIVSRACDYEQYLVEIINWLLEKGIYDVYIIPHVGEDGVRWARNKYKNKLTYCGPFEDPISAKNVISQMDIFLGSRMHATVAAVSSGVPTIPLAYSRKFAGLFNNIGYDYIVDMVYSSTEVAVSNTVNYLTNIEDLKSSINKVQNSIKKLEKNNHELLAEFIKDLKKKAR